MHEVKAFMAFLASIGVLTFRADSVLLQDNTVMDADTLALKSGSPLPVVKTLLTVMTILTAPKSVVMEAVAEEAGMEDFFVAEVHDYSSDGITFTLYGFEGSVYQSFVSHLDLALMGGLVTDDGLPSN